MLLVVEVVLVEQVVMVALQEVADQAVMVEQVQVLGQEIV
tara:strand:- start:66 stop:185 length:120 start_codon:yes stop_codon:yes gene_type:complete